jgi:hypothetical protein
MLKPWERRYVPQVLIPKNPLSPISTAPAPRGRVLQLLR